MAEIQRKVIKQSGRNVVSRLFHAKNDKELIVTWKAELNRILLVFNVRSIALAWLSLIVLIQTELAVNTHVVVVNTHVAVSDIRHDVSKIRKEIGGHIRSVSTGHAQSINRRMLTSA